MPVELPADSRAWIEVDLAAIRHNVETIQKRIGPAIQVMAVVKADAYGHGLVPVTRAALSAGAAWVGVASVAEGIALRAAGVRAPIALLCAANPVEASAIVAYRLTARVGEHVILEALRAARDAEISRGGAGTASDSALEAEPFSIHLEIDTGIGRSGVSPEEALALWQCALQAGLPVTGLTTHFADADGADEAYTRCQQTVFQQTRTRLEQAGAHFEWVHLDNSAATVRYCDVACNLVRPGLLLYGIAPANASLSGRAELVRSSWRCGIYAGPPPLSLEAGLRPALALKARVATVRALPAGHSISYGLTYRLTRPARVATVLIGYGDGYPRRASNQGHLLIQGRKAPILGRICMDQLVVDVTDIPEVQPGAEAVCIGTQGEACITVEQLAALIDTTEHEITTCLTARLPRVIRGERLL